MVQRWTIFTVALITALLSSTHSKIIDGFVYLEDIDPTIRVNLKYFNGDNFIGDRINGYNANRGIMTKEAAVALSKAQKLFNEKGYCILLYDAYRPVRAVKHFMEWISNDDVRNKDRFYPRVDKKRFVEEGYIAEKSGHSSGSTVDLTIIKCDTPHKLRGYPIKRVFKGIELTMMHDNTIDTGTGFDFMDLSSHVVNDIVTDLHKANRQIINEVMSKVGFSVIEEEWWHFILNNEPFPGAQYDFPVQ